jgi:hypothetical protein
VYIAAERIDMNEEIQHKQKLLNIHRSRQYHLEEQAAIHGINTDPGVTIQIEDIKLIVQKR